MRIGIDAHYLGTRSGGNETYTRNLLRGLRELNPPAKFVVFVHDGLTLNDADLEGFETVPLPVRSSYLRVPFALPWLAGRHKLDLLHVQYTAPPICPCPYVVTLHDAVMLRFPESLPFTDRHRLRLLTPGTLRRAKRVLTVTEAMRMEIASAYGLREQDIVVTPNALGPNYALPPTPADCERLRERYELPERFVLSLGQLQPRKNLARLTEAFARLDAGRFPHHLVIAGKEAWLAQPMLSQMRKSGLGERIHFTGYVDEADLPALYALADVFAFVSIYEGFGIPVIESLACGTPVLASTDAALTEVAGGGALHVAADSVDAIAQGLDALLADESLRHSLVAKGQLHAQGYTPLRVAQAAWRAYSGS